MTRAFQISYLGWDVNALTVPAWENLRKTLNLYN